jgi:hypothetical protein
MKTNHPNHRTKISSRNNSYRRPLHCLKKGALITKLNHSIDAHQIPIGVNESDIESILGQWEQHDKCHSPMYWLMAARIFEMSILTAGHYVDNCEFRAAGDLLFNPRKILIYPKDCLRPIVKRRHGRLSDQLKELGYSSANKPFPIWIKNQVDTQIVRPAILPYLLNCLKQSGRLSAHYLQTTQRRLEKASQAIGFLCSWSISDAQDLYNKMNAASPSTRRFINHHLCLFDKTLFNALGKEIHRFGENPNYRSDFITGAHPKMDASFDTKRRS